jgi:plasmid stability protein
MPSLQIRNLPDDLYQAIAFRAERAHRSLAQQAVIELRAVLGTRGHFQREQILSRIRQSIAEEGVASALPAPDELIRDDRER